MPTTNSTRDFERVIGAPIADVWHVLTERFDHIGEWASAIPFSRAAQVAGDITAPVPGRVCENSLPGFDDVTETIIAYSEDPYSFTYSGSGMPAWMGAATNTWHAEPIDEATTRVYFEPQVQALGITGYYGVGPPVLSRQLHRIIDIKPTFGSWLPQIWGATFDQRLRTCLLTTAVDTYEERRACQITISN